MRLGYSFCPNDTFIFYALAHGKVQAPFAIQEVLEDVETLNLWAAEGRLELTKISYAAYGRLTEKYVALRSGGALGRGVGPLLVAAPGSFSDNLPQSLAGRRVAIPGKNTTAFLLLSLYAEGFLPVEMRYDQIMPAVQQGRVDAGLIIHESRFTYPRYGLEKALDLGEWWEQETGLPLPLGAILARRDLGEENIRALDQAVRASLEYATRQPEEPLEYIRSHALEQDDRVIWAHIHTYVNEYSVDLGNEGERAVELLFARARAHGLMPETSFPTFL